MDLGLENKVILVTGGARGIGEGISTVLAQEGAIPVVIGKDESDNKKVVAVIEKNGGKAFYVTTELIHPDECKKAVEKTLEHFGRIDGLVNNAGVNDGVGLAGGSYQKFME
jgi:L-fucose dehydrogenase